MIEKTKVYMKTTIGFLRAVQTHFPLQNLAAFLTVERMVGTVKSMDQLAQQSKVNYTVVQNSSFYEYFKVRYNFFIE